MSSDEDIDQMDIATLKAKLKLARREEKKSASSAIPKIVIKSEKFLKKFDGERPQKYIDWMRAVKAGLENRQDLEKVELIMSAL